MEEGKEKKERREEYSCGFVLVLHNRRQRGDGDLTFVMALKMGLMLPWRPCIPNQKEWSLDFFFSRGNKPRHKRKVETKTLKVTRYTMVNKQKHYDRGELSSERWSLQCCVVSHTTHAGRTGKSGRARSSGEQGHKVKGTERERGRECGC